MRRPGRDSWFRRRRFGLGWTPCSWQGWLVTLAYLGLVVYYGFSLSSGLLPAWFALAGVLVTSVAVVTICRRTGEPPD